MAETYAQIYVHIVFSVYQRESLVNPAFRETLQKYITGIITKKSQKLFSIYCMPDHVHILVSMNPDISISSLVRDIKNNSTRFMNAQAGLNGVFRWQEGFGAFTYSRSQIPDVVRYIENQPRHHQNTSFEEEYIGILNRFGVQYDERYVF